MNKDTKVEHPRFVAKGGKPRKISLLSGHTVSVAAELPGTPLHPRFHRKALSMDCVPAELFAKLPKDHDDGEGSAPGAERRGMIREVIVQMVGEAADSPDQEKVLFTGDGKPSVDVLSRRLGFKVLASERDEAWAEIERDS